MRLSLIAASTVVALGLMGCQKESTTTDAEQTASDTTATAAASDTASMTDVQKQSYAMGASMGKFVESRQSQLATLGGSLDTDMISQGFADTLAGNGKFTEEETAQLLQAAEQTFRKLQQDHEAKAAEVNIAAGKAFLAENAQKEGVQTTESGLQYEVLTAGEGNSPAATDTVKVHYHGTLIDGTVFDSSVDRGEPAVFPLNRVIKGWTEGVQLMKEGSKFRFTIPSELAYGARATGAITPHSTLIFDVELLEIVQPEAQGE